MAGVEDTIFANIEAATGETFDGDGYDTGDVGEQGTDTRKPAERNQPDLELDQVDQQLRGRERPSLEDDQNQRPKPQLKQSDQQQQQRKKPEDADQQKRTDEYGNPIGSKGYHVTRRLKTQVDSLRNVNGGLERQIENLTRQVAEANVLNGLPKQLGLSNEDTAELLQLSAILKANPTEGARKVIEVALAKGANLKDIVNDEFIPNLSLNATRRLLDERLGPIQEERQTRQDVDKQDEGAVREANRFLSDYPEARLHAQVIADQTKEIKAEYAQRGIPISSYVAAEKAFERLQAFCDRNGFDINEDLLPQIEAKKAETRSPSGARHSPSRQPSRPIPNGSNGGGEVVSRRQQTANPDDSYSTIVREALAESGYQL